MDPTLTEGKPKLVTIEPQPGIDAATLLRLTASLEHVSEHPLAAAIVGGARERSDSWGLVHFTRRLPTLTPEDIERMEALNPKTPAQFKEEEEARRFLQGDASGPTSAPPKKGHQD